METSILLEAVIIFVLILLNGFLALAEIAIIASRKTRLQLAAGDGSRGAEAALELANHPTEFLSMVQIGITAVGILVGVFGGATLADHLAAQIALIPILSPYSGAIAVGVVVVLITYLTLVLGELAPKSLALTRPEEIAAQVGIPMLSMSKIASPLVRVLSRSTKLVLALLRVKPSSKSHITESEILLLIEQGTRSGVLLEAEQEMMEGVLRLGDRRIDAMMIPRIEIQHLNLEHTLEENRQICLDSVYSRLPVVDGRLDNLVGVVKVRDILTQELLGQPINIEQVMVEPVFVPENASAMMALDSLRENGEHLAIVIDEFGGTQGLVTLMDILEGIVGEIPFPGIREQPEIIQRGDGSYLLDGMLPIDQFKSLFNLGDLPGEDRGSFQTISGFVMACLGRIPAAGDTLEWQGYLIEVVDMDGFRVDKVIVHPSTDMGY